MSIKLAKCGLLLKPNKNLDTKLVSIHFIHYRMEVEVHMMVLHKSLMEHHKNLMELHLSWRVLHKTQKVLHRMEDCRIVRLEEDCMMVDHRMRMEHHMRRRFELLLQLYHQKGLGIEAELKKQISITRIYLNIITFYNQGCSC